MSRRNCLSNIAVKRLLIASVLICAIGSQCGAKDDAPPLTSQEQSTAPLPVAPPEQKRIAPLDEPPAKSTIYRSACGESGDHDEQDLCEQRRMSQAAIDAVWWARAQTLLGIAGFVAIVTTLLFTASATRAASKAARAAQDSVRVASDTAERELRAYVSLSEVRIDNLNEGQPFKVTLKIKNVGQTPAKEFGAWAQVFYRPHSDDGKIQFTISGRRSVTEMGPVGEYSIPLRAQMLPQAINFSDIASGQMYVIVAGFYSYRDIFKRRRRGIFRYFVRYDHLEAGAGSLVSCNRHNYSN